MRKKLKKYINPLIIFFFIFMIFILIDDITGKSILEGSVYNSYELQVDAWFNGHTYLPHDYSYLELAIYNGHYYVSFPPFPSVFLVPFYVIFFHNIPTNLISFFLFAFEFIVIYKILKSHNVEELNAILLASAFTIGSNILSLAIDSGVWFFAQLLNSFLCFLSVDAFLKKKKMLTYLFLGLAVGCRPFSLIYIIMFFIYFIISDDYEKNISKKIIQNIIPLIPTMIIGIMYMTYNYIRFDNIFEFGHNYLSEFVNAKYGQFSIHYLIGNLKNLFFNGITFDNKLKTSFGMPFSFLVANPIFIVYIFKSIKNIKEKNTSMLRILIFIFTLLNIIFICLHRTLGAWQFGARYTCDVLPFIFLGLIWQKNKKDNILKIKLSKFEIVCIVFGIILNVFGTILMYTDKLF